MNRRPDPLDADERALADLLARDALPGPSPQLDARILAAARAATSTPGRASRRLRPRWIAGMSIAAALGQLEVAHLGGAQDDFLHDGAVGQGQMFRQGNLI